MSSTPVASSGPTLVMNVVKMIVSPAAGAVSSTDFDTTRSTKVGVMVAESPSLVSSESSSVTAVISALLVIGVAPNPASTVASIVRVTVALAVIVPIAHTPVPEVYVPLTVDALTNVTPDGNRSVSTTPVASSGPALNTSIV